MTMVMLWTTFTLWWLWSPDTHPNKPSNIAAVEQCCKPEEREDEEIKEDDAGDKDGDGHLLVHRGANIFFRSFAFLIVLGLAFVLRLRSRVVVANLNRDLFANLFWHCSALLQGLTMFYLDSGPSSKLTASMYSKNWLQSDLSYI